MNKVRCNYCGQVVQFIPVRGNAVCPVCYQSSTSCCEGGSCTVVYTDNSTANPTGQDEDLQTSVPKELLPVVD